MAYKYMVKFSRTVEESRPKKTCSCTRDVRDIQCTLHGG